MEVFGCRVDQLDIGMIGRPGSVVRVGQIVRERGDG